MDTITKIIIVLIIIVVVQSWITHKQPIHKFSISKANIHPGTILLPLKSSNDNQQPKEMFLEITTTPKYGDDYLHIKMTPSNLINQIWFILKGYKDNIVKGNIGYILRVFSPVFNINLLYDQQMYFYLKDGYDKVIKPTFAKLYNNGKEMLLEVF